MRAWVFQEIVCARQPPYVFYGGYSADWDLITYFLYHIQKNGLSQVLIHQGLEADGNDNREPQALLSIPNISAFRHRAGLISPGGKLSHSGLGRPISLEEVLFQSPCFLAADDRDKVFAFLGMANDLEEVPFVPNYDETAEAVFA